MVNGLQQLHNFERIFCNLQIIWIKNQLNNETPDFTNAVTKEFTELLQQQKNYFPCAITIIAQV